MLKLIIGNKVYSSWSLRGWLACKQSGLPFQEQVVPLYDGSWVERRAVDDLAPSSGKVPILWDGDLVVWDSFAILEHLNEITGNSRFWPVEPHARAMARSICAEMHSSYVALRSECGMNVRRTFDTPNLSDAAKADIARIQRLWAQSRARFGGEGDYLFGDFGAADIMFAPVVTRLVTYSIPVSRFAERYIDAVTAHPFMQDWLAAAQDEDWVIDRFESPPQP